MFALKSGNRRYFFGWLNSSHTTTWLTFRWLVSFQARSCIWESTVSGRISGRCLSARSFEPICKITTSGRIVSTEAKSRDTTSGTVLPPMPQKRTKMFWARFETPDTAQNSTSQRWTLHRLCQHKPLFASFS